MQPRTLIAPLACLALAGSTFADPVTGRVVNADGSPAAGARVGNFWQFEGGKASAVGNAAADADDDGRFELNIDFYNRPAAIMAMNAEQTRGGIIVVQPAEAGEEQTITLGPLVELKGEFYNQEFDSQPEWTNVYMSYMPEAEGERPVRIAMNSSTEARFHFKLPPGEYQFWGYGRDVKNHRENIALSADQPVVDRGTVNLEPTVLARHYGKEPPALNITEARGIDGDITLEGLKGKWVLLEFWGFW